MFTFTVDVWLRRLSIIRLQTEHLTNDFILNFFAIGKLFNDLFYLFIGYQFVEDVDSLLMVFRLTECCFRCAASS